MNKFLSLCLLLVCAGCATPDGEIRSALDNAARDQAALDEKRKSDQEQSEKLQREKEQADIDVSIAVEKKYQEHEQARRLEAADRLATSEPIRAAMIDGKVIVGMTTKQVEAIWQKPIHFTRSVSALGTLETWPYSGVVLVFTDGVLTSFTESK